ncbi:protein rep [Lusitaniella coriacea LEGE 07157]|uniref:Protein rep n=1 Tax=Lusitaniella coriacea LEGE 07157 TaxID=945747 RepID=A0A8J7J741_9CYAN|nr:protein rep [Lusitaniella coriacea]MBE9119209.1 protein rep [Lusitaniella coriacea LEGE 07157]
MATSRSPSASTQIDGYIHLTDISPDDKPWDKHRAAATQVQELYEQVGYDNYATRIQGCSQRLLFALGSNEEGLAGIKLHQARFCRVRYCPVCQWRKSMMWRARFFKAIPLLLDDYPKHRFIFLTLTVKNCELSQLRKTIAWMNKSWVKLTKRKVFPALGWVKSVEVTRSDEGLAHPHFHAVLMVKPSYFSGHSYLPQKRWTELWQSCLRVDYTPVVHVKAIKSKKAETPLDEIRIGLCETLKYSVKEADLLIDAEWLAELTRQLHKTRAVSVGGVFKEYLSEEEPEDLIHGDTEEEELEVDEDSIMVFGWREMRYRLLGNKREFFNGDD